MNVDGLVLVSVSLVLAVGVLAICCLILVLGPSE